MGPLPHKNLIIAMENHNDRENDREDRENGINRSTAQAGAASPGRDSHAQRVTLDHHPTSVQTGAKERSKD